VFDEFVQERVVINGVGIATWRAGAGPPVLLVHGYPQTHVMWHRVAPALTDEFTVVCVDLRGYGDSGKPAGDTGHRSYAKRVMAQDLVDVMGTLGHRRFSIAGHDRGGRVALRLALDRPDVVDRLAILDIVPTATIYETLDQRRATTVWRYLFLVQPPDLPERLIGAQRERYLRWTFDEWCGTPGAIADEAMSEYLRCFDEDTIHATCEDYRAGATIDLEHDRADADARLNCPVLVLYSASGIGSQYDVPRIWSRRRDDVHCEAVDCGHFIAEERPDITAAQLGAFFGGSLQLA
jgi:haloacetate dehalogenase